MDKPVGFFAQADVVIVGYNSEAADYDNPKGADFGFQSYVVAEDAQGYRVRFPVKVSQFEGEALRPANLMAERLSVRLAKQGKLPVGFASWGETFPAYGSPAYEAADADGSNLAWEREMEEDFS